MPDIAVQPRALTTTPRTSDRVFRAVVTAGGLTSLVVLALIALFLYAKSHAVFSTFGWHFITDANWTPDDGATMSTGHYGIGAMLVGTLITSAMAIVFALPVSIGLALFMTHYAPNWLRTPMTLLVDLMAAIPSVVFGLWGFFVLMPLAINWSQLINHYLGWIPIFSVPVPIFDRSPFIASLVLAVMIVPIITSIAREVYGQAPRDHIEAAYALGATKWVTLRTVVLPHGKAGVVGGTMLGLGRALGETVAVYMVLNLVYAVNFRVLQSAGGSVASMIVNKFGEATSNEVQGLMAAGLVLFILTLLVNLAANFIVRRTNKGA